MRRLPTLAVVAGLALGLAACSSTRSRKDNIEPPTPLAEFTPSMQIGLLWKQRPAAGAGESGAGLAPMVADGRLYAAGIDGKVAALDAATGRTLWSRHLGEREGGRLRRGGRSLRWTGGPAVAGDLLVVGGLDGTLHALSAEDGSERWQASLPSEVISRPAIADGIVVVRSNDGRLTAFDAHDGRRRWLAEQPVPPLSLRGNADPLVAHGVVFGGYDNGRVVATRLDDGNELWAQLLSAGEGRTEVERLADVDGTLALDGFVLVAAGYRGQLAALAADSGRPLWQRDLSSYAGVAIAGAIVVVVDAEGSVHAFDRETGASRWQQDGLRHRWPGAPAIQGQAIVVGDSEGWVHWLDLDEGGFVARQRLGKDPIETPPQVGEGVVYVQDITGRIGAWRQD